MVTEKVTEVTGPERKVTENQAEKNFTVKRWPRGDREGDIEFCQWNNNQYV